MSYPFVLSSVGACWEYSHFWNLQGFLRACELVIGEEQVDTIMVRRRDSQVEMCKCNDCCPALTQLLGVLGTRAGVGCCGQTGSALASLMYCFLPARKAEFSVFP